MASGGRRSGSIFFILALILIIALAAGAYVYRDVLFNIANPVAAPTAVAPPAQQYTDVVVLTQQLPMGAVITDAAVTVIKFPKESFIEGLYFRTTSEVIGKRVKYPLSSGVVLTTGALSDTAVGSLLSAQIPPGYVAISIPVTRLTSVAYALQAGDHVSVLVTLMLEELDPEFQSALPNLIGLVLDQNPVVSKDGITGTSATSANFNSDAIEGRIELNTTLNQAENVIPSEPQRPRIVSQILISDATVLGVGKLNTPEPVVVNKTPAPGPTPVPTPVVVEDPDMITLIVTPQDSVTLNYLLLTKGARLNLVMRGFKDAQPLKTEAVTLQFLMDQYSIPMPADLPYGLEPRSDRLEYQGESVEPAQ